MANETNTFFEVRTSARWVGRLEINDTLNSMVWGPFKSQEDAEIQLLRLKQLAELDEITAGVENLERVIWEEITIDSESGMEAKKMSERLQKMIDSQLDCMKREQKIREA